MQRIPSKDPKKDLEFLSTEVAIPGGITAFTPAVQYNNLNCIKN